MEDKIMSMREAVKKFVRDEDYLLAHISPEAGPDAFVNEIIRQKKKNLTVITTSALLGVDKLVGSGCVRHLITSYCGSEFAGINRCLERALTQGIPNKIEIEDYSHFTLSLALMAGAMGIPFIPGKSLLGSDIIHYRTIMGDKKLKVIEDPFKGGKVVLIPAINPDVGIFHAQLADNEGNVQYWGTARGIKWEAFSCKKIIFSVEEIVDSEIIRRNPFLTIVPSFRVNAIVHEPWGAHPCSLVGYYDMDKIFMLLYNRLSENVEGFEKFMDEWVYGVENRTEYIEHYIKKFGYARLRSLIPKPLYSFPINCGLYLERDKL